jgi:hypothetical protein
MLLIPMCIPYGAIAVGTFTMCIRVIFKTVYEFRHFGATASVEGDEE